MDTRYCKYTWALEEPHSQGGKRTSQQGAEEGLSQQGAEEGEGGADPGTFEDDWEVCAFPRPLARPEDEAAGSAAPAGSAHELSDSD